MRKSPIRGKRLRLSMENGVAGGGPSCTGCDHSGGGLTAGPNGPCTDESARCTQLVR